MNAYLMTALPTTPLLVKAAFDGLARETWDNPTHPDRFTPREVIAHMADWEPILLGRMKQCVERPGSTLVPFDEGQMAVDNGYSSWDPESSFQSYRAARDETVRWLASLHEEDWAKSGVHPERGVQTVYDMANTLVCHDVYHIRQLSGL